MLNKSCPFCKIVCDIGYKDILIQNAYGFVVRDRSPVTAGHSLIVPNRHIDSFFDISDEERQALFSLLDLAKLNIDTEYQPDAFTIGVNDGPAAGQTVPHLHIHLIPRYAKDGDDARGVRWVVPEKAVYTNE
jgi:diadenosine tetraphosphate (Ap4A) HIT family hydrolase